MATTVKARGQITIVDLNDAKQVQLTLERSGSNGQLYNPDEGSYSPDFTTNALVLTPRVYVTGESASQTAQCTDMKWTITGKLKASGSSETITLDGSNPTRSGYAGYTMGSDGSLTISANLLGNFITLKFTCTHTDADSGAENSLMAQETLIRTTAASSLFSVVVTCPKGYIFDTEDGTTALTAVAAVYRGTAQDTSGTTYTWEKLDTSTGTWAAVAASKVSGSDNTSTLSVLADDIVNFQTFRVTATDDGDTSTALVTFEDKTDPYEVELVCPTGDKIVNGTGSTTINARVYHRSNVNEYVETESTSSKQFTYTWTKYNKSGVATNWSGTSSTTKTGNPVTVLAADVDTKCTIYCEVSK